MRGNSRKPPQSKPTTNNNMEHLNSGNSNPFSKRPKTLTCSICGREFGTQSLEIHQKTCIQKYQNSLNNLSTDHRKHMPSVQQMKQQVEQEKQYRQQRPMSGGGSSMGGGMAKGKGYYDYNQAPVVNVALVPCRRCGRKFNPDRIGKHESVCIGPEPDIARIKQQQVEQNKRAAKYLRPKQTGKWRAQHREFQNALKEMRKVTMMERMEGRGGFGGNRGYNQQSYGRPPPNNRQMPNNSYNYDQRKPASRGNQHQQYDNYPKSTNVTRKAPHQQQHMRTPPQRQQQFNPPQQKNQPIRSSSSKPINKGQGGGGGSFGGGNFGGGNFGGASSGYGQPKGGYGRDLPQGFGGGGGVAHTNVSTFSLFTSDGRPPDYSQYQRQNPYAKKTGLY